MYQELYELTSWSAEGLSPPHSPKFSSRRKEERGQVTAVCSPWTLQPACMGNNGLNMLPATPALRCSAAESGGEEEEKKE